MMKRISFIGFTMLALLAGCTREEDFPSLEEASTASVNLFLDVDSPEGTDVKSWTTLPVNEPDAKVAIKNVWVLQFDATTEVLATDPIYIASYSSGISTKLNTGLNHPSLLVFLANTFNSHLSLGTAGTTTLDEFKKKFFTITDEKSLFSLSNGEYYQRLSGACEVPAITGAMSVGSLEKPVLLKRNMARIIITLQNNTTDDATHALRIIGVQMCSMPVKDYLYVNYASPDVLPAIFPPDIAKTVDYDTDLFFTTTNLADWADDTETIKPGGTKTDLYYYVPANKRGTSSVSEADKKNTQAPHGSTFYRVYAYDKAGRSYAFIFYLGANLTGDYNLCPNCSYEFTFAINDTWFDNVGTDPRINHYKTEWDLTGSTEERSNCYILAVPPTPEPTYFKIPIEKANMFWKNEAYKFKPGTENPIEVREYGSTSVFYSTDMCIDSGDWEVDILWSDFNPGEGNLYFTNEEKTAQWTCYSGNGSADTGYFILAVKGGVQGNAVVGLKKKLQPKEGDSSVWSDLDCYVWSWHLWFTDYEPDQLPASPPADEYFYKVSGGKVLRYALSDPFMMDRDLGATYNPNNPAFLSKVGLQAGREDATLGMFYQFGRKDPFPNYRPLYYHGSTTASLQYEEVKSANAVAILKTDAYMGKVKRSNLSRSVNQLLYTPNAKLNVPFTINHPMIYIYGSDSQRAWNVGDNGSYKDQFNPQNFNADIIWMDPAAKNRNSAKWGNEKSVFDPCPKGWKLPTDISASGNWKAPDDVNWPVARHKSLAQFVNAWGEPQVYGCYLWPQQLPVSSAITEADLDRADFYPFSGYMLYTNGEMVSSIDALSSDNRLAPHWTSKLRSNVYGMSLSLSTVGYDGVDSFHTQGYSIRCVKY